MWFIANTQRHTPLPSPVPLPVVSLRSTPQGGRQPQPCVEEEATSEVRVYSCGPTVYDTAHIGNLRAYVVADTLNRVLRARGHKVRHTINITDFGHLTSDADEGEDKMLIALAREGLPRTMEAMRQVADTYTRQFFRDLDVLNIPRDRYQFPRASEHVPGMVAIVQTLLERGYAYRLEDGIYFDTSTFPEYGLLGNVRAASKEAGARVAPHPHKRQPEDFALWKFSDDATLGWEAPWGRGFPGWHTECVAMIFATLGRSIHIHTGGEDHIAIHHNNEIAQAEVLTGRPLARCWLHNAFVTVEGRKIAKSIGNVIKLSHLEERGFAPLALRYFFLQAHYRTPINFTWEGLTAAQQAYRRLREHGITLKRRLQRPLPFGWDAPFVRELYAIVADDLKTPQALAFVWKALETLSEADQWVLLQAVDALLGLRITEVGDDEKQLRVRVPLAKEAWPAEVARLVAERERYRREKDYEKADALRTAIHEAGYAVVDTPEGPELFPLEEGQTGG